MRISTYLFLLLSLVFLSCQDKKTSAASSSSTQGSQSTNFTEMDDQKKVPYALGYKYAEGTSELELSEADQELFLAGIKAFFKTGKKASPEINHYSRKIDQIVREKRAKLSKIENKTGEEFVAKVLADGTYKQSQTGLLYHVTKEGEKPKKLNEDSVIELNYTSHFLNDEQYESTMEGNPRLMSYRGMLKAWKEAVKIAGVGGSIEIIAPPALTYGVHGAMPTIKPGQYLKFKMNFYKVINKKK